MPQPSRRGAASEGGRDGSRTAPLPNVDLRDTGLVTDRGAATVPAVVAAELATWRHHPAPWGTLAAFLVGPAALALFVWIVAEPGRAASLGLLGTKADLSGLEATWPAYGSALPLLFGMGGMIVLPFVVALVFAHDAVDGTAKHLYGLAIPRRRIVAAKALVALAWWAGLVVAALLVALAAGLALRLPGLAPEVLGGIVGRSLLAAGVATLLSPVTAWVAVVTRGYLAPVGAAFGLLAVGNVLSHTGWWPWFGWSVVPALTGMIAEPAATLPVQAPVMLLATCLLGAAGTLAHVERADVD